MKYDDRDAVVSLVSFNVSAGCGFYKTINQVITNYDNSVDNSSKLYQ